jgi:hypothetical protein
MHEMFYNTWARSDHHWARKMLEGWRQSNLPFLSFPWINYQLFTLPTSVYWLYLFYSAARTDILELQSKIEFRLQIVSWRHSTRFTGPDVYQVNGEDDATVWFMVDRFEELRRTNGELLSLQDFQHAHGQNILTVMRQSIPQVVINTPVQIIQKYPG